MELLNHFVAARLMKDAQLFERIGRHGAMPRLPKPLHPALPAADVASEMPDGSASPVRDDRRFAPLAEHLRDSRYP